MIVNANPRRLAVILILIVVPLLVAAALMKLFGSYLLPAPSPVAGGEAGAIVVLDNGITLQADKGTVSRDVVDWLNARRPGERLFDVRGHQFVGDTAELTAESRGRLHRLAMLLRAEKDVTARIVAFAPSQSDRDVEERRARVVLQALAADGVAAERLAFEVRDVDASRASGGVGRVAIVLARQARSED